MPPLNKKKFSPSTAVTLLLSSSVLFATQAFAVPSANPDSYTTTKGQSITFNPMKNDAAYGAGNWIYIEEVDSPAPYGTGATSISNGKITYIPPANFTGTTSFFYGIRDQFNDINSAEIKITVTDGGGGVPQPSTPSPFPKAYGQLDTVAAAETILIDALRNDVGDGLTITGVDNPFGRRSDGSYFSTGTTSIVNNKIRFVADSNFEGKTTFWYRIKDSEGRTNSGPTSVQVTAATGGSNGPEANDDSAEYIVADRQGGAIWIAPFWNDKGTELKITGLETNTDQNNSAVIVDNNRQISYTPKSGFSGSDTFDYTVTDKFGRTDTATIRVAVVGSNTTFARPVANGDAYPVSTNASNVTLNVLNNDQANNDPGGRTLFVEPYSQNGATAFVDGSIVYTPNANFVGTDEFYYSITDTLGRADSAKVVVTVSGGNGGGDNGGGDNGGGVNQSPDAREDVQRISIVPGSSPAEREIFVLGNDVDPDGDILSVQSVGQVRSGSVRLESGRVLYTPPNFLTSSGFVYVVSDGNGGTDAAAVTLGIVDSINPTTNPVVSNENVTVAPGATLDIPVLFNDNDPDGDTLILDQITGGSQGTITKIGNTIRYTANGNASGTDAIFYGVADGQGGNGSGTVNITIQ